jgi:hypothetical protein
MHRATFGVWIDPAAFAEHLIHIPNSMPIDPFSNALLLVSVLGLGAWLMVRSTDLVTAGRDRAATILLFAAATYFVGESAPAVLCSLLPFLVLVALRVLDRPIGAHSLLSDVTAFGLATSVAALAMSPWRSTLFDSTATFNINDVVARSPSLEPNIEHIRGEIANPDNLGIVDFTLHHARHSSETTVWTPLGSSFALNLPIARRHLYIQRSAARLRRSGWAIFGDDQLEYYEDLLAGYTVTEQRVFDGAPSPGAPARHYIAACFNPQPELASSIVGPACPPSTMTELQKIEMIRFLWPNGPMHPIPYSGGSEEIAVDVDAVYEVKLAGFYGVEASPTGHRRRTNGDARIFVSTSPEALPAVLSIELANGGPVREVQVELNGSLLYSGPVWVGSKNIEIPAGTSAGIWKVEITSDTFKSPATPIPLGLLVTSVRLSRK